MMVNSPSQTGTGRMRWAWAVACRMFPTGTGCRKRHDGGGRPIPNWDRTHAPGIARWEQLVEIRIAERMI